MNKSMIYALTLALVSAIFIPTYAEAHDDNATLPHIGGNSEFAQSKWAPVRHSFDLHIPKNSKAVSQLIIQVPDVIRISDKNRIDVVDTQGQKIDTNISVNGKIIVLTFLNTVAPNTKLEIDINNVKRPIGGNGSVYQMSAKFFGSDVVLPVGFARFRVNG
ncbi:MAG: DUF2808 domain-containing protein [Cyanomargarita calcarea GSE-NOS-MK-12-04C]|jgi:hypothetical protein|uniref:DUF2808 domain-containing protein n=1 Tax=Cyanomargarita calcarea GSE-NOS-MK-12-04C TaxID=2839659 RepID=A0A951QPK7_9CYAN|nr:DUF2808 domain-containing protein [Cyanomargarita calcarea GSE-NOS-MK-12-04C]